MKSSWIVYAALLIAALAVDTFLQSTRLSSWSLVPKMLAFFFNAESLFLSQQFQNAVVRSSIAFVGSVTILGPALLIRYWVNSTNIVSYFSFEIVPFVWLLAIFLYLNYHSPNYNHVVYALLSYTSILLFVLREHIFFFTQQWFAKDDRALQISSIFALIVFILVHPFTVSQGNIIGTFLIINLWIYTVTHRNIWMGVALHTAWNFVLPHSAMFHYLLFVYSCFLAFGRDTYPTFLSTPFSWVAPNRARVWRNFWRMPTRLYRKAMDKMAA